MLFTIGKCRNCSWRRSGSRFSEKRPWHRLRKVRYGQLWERAGSRLFLERCAWLRAQLSLPAPTSPMCGSMHSGWQLSLRWHERVLREAKASLKETMLMSSTMRSLMRFKSFRISYAQSQIFRRREMHSYLRSKWRISSIRILPTPFRRIKTKIGGLRGDKN